MTWHTLDGKHLVIGRMKALANELRAEEPPKKSPERSLEELRVANNRPPEISPWLRAYIENIAAQMAYAQREENSQWER